MTRYLLDTNMASTLADTPKGIVNRRIRQVGLANVCISVIVAGELLYGGMKRNSLRLQQSIDAILEMIDIEPMSADVAPLYGVLRHDLTRRGATIGPNDLWIAAHALALECTLVTANTGEFNRVPGLSIENWLAD